jgi:hypothetical protein
MADGDLSITVTVNVPAVPTLVTHPRTGRGADDTDGQMPRSTGNVAQERTGGDVQESNGNLGRGRTGKVN